MKFRVTRENLIKVFLKEGETWLYLFAITEGKLQDGIDPSWRCIGNPPEEFLVEAEPSNPRLPQSSLSLTGSKTSRNRRHRSGGIW